jgi:hypothetical protein
MIKILLTLLELAVVCFIMMKCLIEFVKFDCNGHLNLNGQVHTHACIVDTHKNKVKRLHQ